MELAAGRAHVRAVVVGAEEAWTRSLAAQVLVVAGVVVACAEGGATRNVWLCALSYVWTGVDGSSVGGLRRLGAKRGGSGSAGGGVVGE